MLSKNNFSEIALDEIPNNLLNNPTIRFRVYLITKRLFDLFFALTAVVLMLPMLVIIAILIKFDSKGPILNKQERFGKAGRKFFVYKFRTMRVCNIEYNNNLIEKGVFKIKRDPRITNIGSFLRKTSISELPQLINIIKGEMSIVGPRPGLSFELFQDNRYSELRKMVKPGLTGLFQVTGRINSYEEMIKIDSEYVNKASFIKDLKIILKTVKVTFR